MNYKRRKFSIKSAKKISYYFYLFIYFYNIRLVGYGYIDKRLTCQVSRFNRQFSSVINININNQIELLPPCYDSIYMIHKIPK